MHPLRFLERHFGRYISTGTEALFKCPFCKHHKPKLSVNTNNFYWKCWVCDEKGRNLLSLVSKKREPALIAAFKTLFPAELEVKVNEEQADFVLDFPQEYQPLCQNFSSYKARQAMAYLKSRNVTTTQIIRHKIGYAKNGMFKNRVIVPSFAADGTLNFFAARAFTKQSLKYLNPKTPPGYKQTVIFNELNVDWRRPVYIVEGFFDMLRFTDNAIPLCGNVMSEESKLLLSLVKYEPDIYVCLDSDARKKQLAMLKMLNSFGLRCFDVDVSPFKDVGEMSFDILAQKQTQAHRANKVSILRERIRSL